MCGAHFGYGTMFKHEPTGEIVHMGHDCANKYGAMYDLSAWELANNRIRAAAAKHIKRTANDREREQFLGEHPGLADAFTVEHPIIADIRRPSARASNLKARSWARNSTTPSSTALRGR